MDKLDLYYGERRRTTLNRMREGGSPDPFKILIGCLVSINIKDEVCEKILDELFNEASSFEEIIKMDTLRLEEILYNARYRRVKATRLKSVSKEILERFNGVVPDDEEELLSIKGIGPKTCNVVLNFAFGKNKIPVDSNTVRIMNRLGLVNSEMHKDVEEYLVSNLNSERLRNANALFMLHGKETCVSISPFCSKCVVQAECLKVGVEKSR